MTPERAPWLRLAVEARWRLLAHLQHEHRAAVRDWLLAELRQLEVVIRDRRAA